MPIDLQQGTNICFRHGPNVGLGLSEGPGKRRGKTTGVKEQVKGEPDETLFVGPRTFWRASASSR